jgi:hypothetical protein
MLGIKNLLTSTTLGEYKLTKGALFFAYNTSSFNYLAMADVAAALVKKHLKIPVAVVTDSASAKSTPTQFIDQVIIEENTESNHRLYNSVDSSDRIEWRNKGRESAYRLTPFDQTLLLDSDYLVFTDRLVHVFDSGHDFLCFRDVYDVTGQNVFAADQFVGKSKIPMIWATVVYFTRNQFSEDIFDFVSLVKDNYRYYSLAYNFPVSPYRNDYAFSLALHTINGYHGDQRRYLPWSMPSLTSRASIRGFDPVNQSVEFLFANTNMGNRAVSRVWGQDLHLMNKQAFNDAAFVNSLLEYARA